MNILLIEDNPGDARLIRESLRETGRGTVLVHVETMKDAEKEINNGRFDVLLLDLSLPDTRGLNTVAAANAVAPNIPIVVLTGLDDETLALEAVRIGAQDYLIKGQTLGPLLMRAMTYAIERQRLTLELKEALATVKKLSGLLPICASCKKIRDDTGYWTQVEEYIEERTDASFTHGLCPDCVQRIFPEYAEEDEVGSGIDEGQISGSEEQPFPSQ